MIGARDIWAILRTPTQALRDRLKNPPPAHTLFLFTVTPFVAIRALALFVRSAIVESALSGLVLGLGHFALQVGTWLGVAILLPALARQFRGTMNDRQGFALATYASIPMWTAGIFYAVPDEPMVLYGWAMTLVAAGAVWGFLILHRGFVALGVRRSMRMPLLGSTAVASLTIYAVLFLLLGIGSLILLYLAGR